MYFKRWRGGGGGRAHKRNPVFPTSMFHNTALPNTLWSLLPTLSFDDGSLYAYVRCYTAEGYHNPTEMKTRTVNSIEDDEHI